jgi:hypothetical protein
MKSKGGDKVSKQQNNDDVYSKYLYFLEFLEFYLLYVLSFVVADFIKLYYIHVLNRWIS